MAAERRRFCPGRLAVERMSRKPTGATSHAPIGIDARQRHQSLDPCRQRAFAARGRVVGRERRRLRWWCDQHARSLQRGRRVAGREQLVVPDAREALREHVIDESLEKLDPRQHALRAALRGEDHAALVHRAEVRVHLLGAVNTQSPR